MISPCNILQDPNFLGRQEEKRTLLEVDAHPEASIVVVYGRRRVGKTELLEQTFRERNLIKFEGLEGEGTARQMKHVLYQLARYADDRAIERLRFTRWIEFFDYLARFVEHGVWTLYFEELQWLASYRGEFISELKQAWDNTLRRNPRLVVVLCGSAPSFMLGKVLRSKALYGRVFKEIHLRPFPLSDTAAFIGGSRSAFDVMDAQLALGGIPEYLKLVREESSTYLALCKNAFVPNARLLQECDRIFVSSLGKNVHYRKVLEFLAARRSASRNEIAVRLRLKPGGTLSALLDDLESSGFIEGVIPYDKGSRGKLVRYQIADPYLHFYYRFVFPQRRAVETGTFLDRPTEGLPLHEYQQWLGFAFERWCRSQHHRLAEILGFSGVRYRSGVWMERGKRSGFEFDLVFERADRVLTVCEIKYTVTPVGSAVAKEFARKLQSIDVPRRTTIHRVLVSASGAAPEVASGRHFDRIVTIEDIFGRT
jgi:AAA+ ATPase superfamily predicted ATPase